MAVGDHHQDQVGGDHHHVKRDSVCAVCGVLGDERNTLYEYSLVTRDGIDLNKHLHCIWCQPDIFKLFE